MRIFLDTSVLLAASGSATGASHEIFRLAPLNDWILVSSPYVIEETLRNLPKIGSAGIERWKTLRPALEWVDDIFALDRPVVFGPAKDKPVLFTALRHADHLITLDDAHLGSALGRTFYELKIWTPGDFLDRQRMQGTLYG